jgi:hypothetical protein
MPPGTNAYNVQLYRDVSGWNLDLQTLLGIVNSATGSQQRLQRFQNRGFDDHANVQLQSKRDAVEDCFSAPLQVVYVIVFADLATGSVGCWDYGSKHKDPQLDSL